MEAENRVLLLQNQALEKEVYLLRNSSAYMEKVFDQFGTAWVTGQVTHEPSTVWQPREALDTIQPLGVRRHFV